MTISTTTNRVDVSGNGSATVFAFAPVIIFQDADLQVTLRDASGIETTLTQGTGSNNYSISVSTYPGTGSITYPASGGTPLPVGSTLTIKRVVALLQEVALANQGAYLPAILEGAYDLLTAMAQQLQEQVNRTVQLSVTDPATPLALPSTDQRANQFLAFDGAGAPVAGQQVTGTPVSVPMQPVVSASSLAAARNTLITAKVFTPQQFGAVGNGSTDDTAAMQAWLDAVTTARTQGYAPAATYKITSALTISGSCRLFGDWAGTNITTSHATADIFNVQSGSVIISDFSFNSTVAKTGGSYINLPGIQSGIKIERCTFTNHAIGINIAGGALIDIANCNFYNAVASIGIGIQISGGFDLAIRHVLMDALTSPQPFAGLYITSCGDIVIDDCNIIRHQSDMLIAPTSGQVVSSIYMSNSFLDTSSGYGLQIIPNGTGSVVRCHWIGCWFSSHSIDGVLIIPGASATVDGMSFTECEAYLNNQVGFFIFGGTNITLNGCRAAANGVAGCSVAANLQRITVVNSKFGPSNGLTANGTGLFFAAGTGDRCVVTGNDCYGNTTANFGNGMSGSLNQIANNIIT